MQAKTKKIVIKDFGSYLGRDKGCLIVKDKDRNEKRYPLFDNEIGEIQVRSGNCISSGALATCGFWNIDVVVATGRGQPVAILKSLSNDSHVKTRICQYEAYKDERSLGIAKIFLLAKLEGQDKLLKKYGLHRFDYLVYDKIKNLEVSDIHLARNKLRNIEGLCAEKYFEQVFGIFNEAVRPPRRKGYKAYDGINNIYNLAYKVLSWKAHTALLKAHLEPYLGFLHEIAFGRPSLICDFIELYRYLMDDFIISYARKLKPSDFSIKEAEFSTNKKGKRQYLKDEKQQEFFEKLESYFQTKVDIPRVRVGNKQEIESLINEEAMLFAKYLRGEKSAWIPRGVELK
ncbi:MAG: CRISPR-associated endonuclease Cas1 [Candidatus Bathyarchaeota archaeon]|nr:CRISPR-associated endonuclease Cas1 [Candidatus Bathyarchaeota archaeon]